VHKKSDGTEDMDYILKKMPKLGAWFQDESSFFGG